jgi:hypothetical protein
VPPAAFMYSSPPVCARLGAFGGTKGRVIRHRAEPCAIHRQNAADPGVDATDDGLLPLSRVVRKNAA